MSSRTIGTHRKMAQEGGGLPEGDSLANDCETIIKNPTDQGWKAMEAWQQWLMDRTKQAVKQHLIMKHEEWNSKVGEAVRTNSSLAFKLIREPQGLAKGYIVEKNGQIIYDAKAVLKEQEQIWAKWWAADNATGEDDLDITKLPNIPMPKIVCHEELRQVAGSFKQDTSCVDQWHPRRFSGMSDEALQAASKMFAAFEAAATWPRDEQEVLTALIPKTDGGLRLIALFRTAYRVYANYRRQEVRTWAEKHSGYQCNNAKPDGSVTPLGGTKYGRP